ncbi:MAG: protein kinase domain-containing protein [Gemmataceae bacterium]
MEVDPKRIRAVFLSAVEDHAPEQWNEYLGEVCRDEPEVRRRVEVLLRGHREPNEFLDNAAAAPVPSAPVLIGEGPGTIVGAYKLLEQIGEGGFGVVFMAEQQQPVRRKVALKIVKPGMDTRQVVARFEAERQALAIMDHPNIARVFDGGATESGRPYFVMELVRGIPISDFCDQNRLGIRERLELFVEVCGAVQHAHQKGIIHRDLKPSNVMVTMYDDKPVAKVIDFGIAKATGQQLTEKTLFTNYAQLIGTPMYMSPEQAQMTGLDVDTRSDVYSLGVMLYELLTGTTPFDKSRLQSEAYDEVRRIIREEEPIKPSTRMSTLQQSAKTLTVHGTNHPKQLSRLLRGELDWIVMKSLEKDRNRRFDSAGALAADVQRYLHDEPVLACPPTVGYRLKKMVRRNKRSVVAAAALLMVLLAGMFGTTWGLIRATAARADAVIEASQKKAALADREIALADAQDKLFLSLLNQARVERNSGQVGQRFMTLKTLREAAKIRVTPELRTEATSALVLADIEIAHEWSAVPETESGLSFSADFTKYARMEHKGNVLICRFTDGREEIMLRLPAHGQPQHHFLRLSPDGRFVAYGHSGTADGKLRGLRIWRIDGRGPEVLLDEPAGMNNWALEFHPDGRQFVVGHSDSSISFYDLANGQRLRRIKLDSAPMYLACHPSNGRLAVSDFREVQILEASSGKVLSKWSHSAYTLAWHPDGRRLATGGDDQKIHIWDTDTGLETMPPWDYGSKGVAVTFNHAGNRLISRSWTRTTYLWDTATGRRLLTLPDLESVQFSSDDRTIGYSFKGNKIRLWHLADGAEQRVLARGSALADEQIQSFRVDTDGRMIAAETTHCLCFFDLASGEELAASPFSGVDATSPIHFNRADGWVTAGMSGVWAWPIQPDPDRSEVLRIGPPGEIAPGLGSQVSFYGRFSSDGRTLAIPNGRVTIVIHRDHPERRIKLGPQYDLRFCAISPDGRLVATCSHWSDGRNKSTTIWNAETGEQVRELPLEDSTQPLFSPDGRWLVTVNTSGTKFWDVTTWECVRQFDPASFAFSPDSRMFALGDISGGIRLVETETGHEIARLTSHENMSVGQFAPDGTRLIIYGANRKTLYVWDLGKIRQQLKALGLDWEWPEFAQAEPVGPAPRYRKVELILGDLGPNSRRLEERARQAIDRYRREVEANPESSTACNNLAWYYLTGPDSVRDVKAALPLAEKAVRLRPTSALFINTLGVAYYRNDRFQDALRTLRPNLDRQDDQSLPFDLYILAMSHHQLGETAKARVYFDWAVRWQLTHRDTTSDYLREQTIFRNEAEQVLKQDPK